MFNVRCSPTHAFTLIECLVYMSVLFVFLGIGYTAMYSSMDASTGLRRNAADISQTLKAGESWRDDVRNAHGPIRVENAGENGIVLHIPQSSVEVDYRIYSSNVSRRIGQQDWQPVLKHVRASNFVADRRQTTTAWRWEIELQKHSKRLSGVRPLFTFVAVPAHSTP